MGPVQVTVLVPGELGNAVRLVAAEEGDTAAVILCTVEDQIAASRKRRGR